MTILSINFIALFLGAVLLAPRHDGHGHLFRYARKQARSESDTKAHAAHLRPERRSGLVASAISLPVERATISAATDTSVRDEARLFGRITGPRVGPMRQS